MFLWIFELVFLVLEFYEMEKLTLLNNYMIRMKRKVQDTYKNVVTTAK